MKKRVFSERVVRLAQSIPFGRVTTYGRIARAAGAGSMAVQSITTILAKARDNGVRDISFHRIVYADGHIWISPSYRAKRMKLYNKEGIIINERDQILNFRSILFEYA